MSIGTTEQQMDKAIEKVKQQMLSVVKNAIRKTVEEAQRSDDDGGKMRVDTGFLRWSGTASLNSIPSGLSQGRLRQKGEVGVLPEYVMDNEGGKMLNECLINMKLGDVLYFGWTARYAKYREIYDGFMVSAVNNFNFYINEEARRLK